MSLFIKIESINNIPLYQINSLLSSVCESIMEKIINRNEHNDLYFNYTVNLLRCGYKKIKEGDPILEYDCVICCERFVCGEYKRTLECKHSFHKRCIDVWLRNKYDCPCCRSSII